MTESELSNPDEKGYVMAAPDPGNPRRRDAS